MNNELIFNNYLLLLKSTTEVYVHGTLESTNELVHNVLKDCLNETLDMQNKTYETMTNEGWYINENISQEKINEVYQKIIDKNKNCDESC